MSGRFANRGNFTIPSAVFDEHEWVSDMFLDGEIGSQCTLMYPPIDSECSNCYFDPNSGRSNNIYRVGGLVPFTNHTTCPMCGGEGRSITEKTEDVRLRVYTDPSHWVETGIQLKSPNGIAQVIGYMADLPKIERADKIILHSELQEIKRWIVQAEGEAIPWGFRGNRYFVMFVKRVGGG